MNRRAPCAQDCEGIVAGGRFLLRHSHGDGPPELRSAVPSLMVEVLVRNGGRCCYKRCCCTLGDLTRLPVGWAAANGHEEPPLPHGQDPTLQAGPCHRGSRTDDRPGAHAPPDLGCGDPAQTVECQRPGDRRCREEPPRHQTEGTDGDDRGAALASVAPQPNDLHQGATSRALRTADLAFAHAMPVQHDRSPWGAAGRAAAGALSWSSLLGGRGPQNPGLDLERVVYKPLFAPFSYQRGCGARRGGCGFILHATFYLFLLPMHLLRLLLSGELHQIGRVVKISGAMEKRTPWVASHSNTLRENMSEAPIRSAR